MGATCSGKGLEERPGMPHPLLSSGVEKERVGLDSFFLLEKKIPF
jgi:hypothetical protein